MGGHLRSTARRSREHRKPTDCLREARGETARSAPARFCR
jgi:hypothetical protein